MLPAQVITLSPSFKQPFFAVICDSEAEKPHFCFSSWTYVRLGQEEAQEGDCKPGGGRWGMLFSGCFLWAPSKASCLPVCAAGISLACFLTPAAETLSLDAGESSLQ